MSTYVEKYLDNLTKEDVDESVKEHNYLYNNGKSPLEEQDLVIIFMRIKQKLSIPATSKVMHDARVRLLKAIEDPNFVRIYYAIKIINLSY